MEDQAAIKIKVTLQEKDLEDFYAHLSKRSLGMKMVVVFAILIFVAQSIRIIINPEALENGILWILFVLLLFGMMIYSNKYNARKAYRNNKRLLAEYTYIISDRSIIVESEKRSIELLWNNIHEISESKNSLFLWLNKKQAQIIPKRYLSVDELEAIYMLKKLTQKK